MPKLEFDISVKEGGLKELTKQINLVKQETSKLVAEFGKESQQAQLAGEKLEKLTAQKRQLTKAVTELGGGVKRSSAQLLEMGENITTVAAGVTAALYGITSLAKESVMLSANLNVLRANFQGTNTDLELFRQATAGTVSDANLIKLSNQAGDLGVSLDKQALLFSLAEDAADKYGGSVEENFQRVVMATEGNIKGLKSLGIQKEVYNKTVQDLVKAHGGEIEMLQGVNGEQELNIKKLDPAIQKQIRLEAILKLTGVTLESVKNKTQDQKDKLEAMSVQIEVAKTKFGDLLMNGVEPIITGFLKFGDTGSVVVGAVTQMGGAMTAILPAIAGMKMAFGGGLLATLGVVGSAIAGITALILNAKFALDQFTLAASGNWRQTLGGKLFGLDQTNSEENAKNETGFTEGVMNRFKQLSDLRSKFGVNKTDSKITGINKGGKSPRTQQFEQETEAIDNESKALKRLASDFEKFAFAGIFTDGSGEARSKYGPATQDTKAQSTVTPQISLSELANAFSEMTSRIKDVFSNLMETLNINADTFIGKLVSGFETILSLIQTIISVFETIKTAQSFLGMITSIFTGGAGAGLGLSASPMALNNNVYISANMDGLTFMKTNVPKYTNYQRMSIIR